MPDRPILPNGDPADLDSTQPNPPATIPPPPPMPHGKGHVQPRLPERRRHGRKEKVKNETRIAQQTGEMPLPPRRYQRRERNRSDSGMYLPAWSVLLMLVVVFGIAGFIVVLVLTLGGQSNPTGEPRVVIVTAIPSLTPAGGAQVAGLPTLPANSGGDASSFGLEGPALPTTVLTPTRQTVSVGKVVRVINVGLAGLNIRSEAGTNGRILFQAEEGDAFMVVDGPDQIDNLTWWQLRSTTDESKVGWAVENDGEQDVLAVAETPQ
jgi:hypothetical protein